MKQFIDKLIGRLEEYQENNTQCKSSDDYELGQFNACEYAIEIVNQLAEETSVYRVPLERGEWIPVSERLPEKGKAVLTCTKDGWISVNINMSYNGKKNEFECGYYTAWMPLPAPYQTKGE